MPLFQVAILEHPTKQGKKDGEAESIKLSPTSIISNDAQTAGYVAVLKHLKEEIDHTRMEVIVIPFG